MVSGIAGFITLILSMITGMAADTRGLVIIGAALVLAVIATMLLTRRRRN